MYALWLKTNPNATRGQLIKALGVIRANTLADKYKKWISSTGRATPSVRLSTAQLSLDIKDLQKVLNLLQDAHFNGDWEGLGLELGLYQHPTLSNLQHTHGRGAALRECLAVWLQRADGVDKNGGANYVSLANAVERLGQRAAADHIRRQCGIETAQEEAPVIGENTDNIDDPIEPGTLKKWFDDEEEGWIDLTLTRVHMVGPAGSGKTCTQNLLLNEDPPPHFESSPRTTSSEDLLTSSDTPSSDPPILEHPSSNPQISSDTSPSADHHASSDSTAGVHHNTTTSSSSKSITDSTPIACKAVKALRIAIGDNETWSRMTKKELLERLSSRLKHKLSQQKGATSPPSPSNESASETREVTQEAPEEPRDYGSVVKDIVKLLPEAKAELSEKWAYIIDSGGQPAFQELLPLFTRTASLNIVTLDLSKGLDDEFEYTYRVNGEEFPCDKKMKYSNRKVFNSVVSAASVQKPLNIRYQKKPSQDAAPIHSMSFVLGTHYDELIKNSKDEKEAEAEVKKMSDGLMKQLDPHSKQYIIPVRVHEDSTSIIFQVNTLINDSEERKRASQEIFKIVDRSQTSLSVRLPIRLFIFELCLEERAESKGGFVTKDEAYDEGKRLHMSSTDVGAALTYLHNCTIILYYPDIEPHLVFVNPDKILEVLSQLLALTYVNKDTAHEMIKPKSEIAWNEMALLKNYGRFDKDLLDKFAVFTDKFESDYFIELLKKCHIIAELRVAGVVYYFLPSALRSYNGSFEKSPPDRQPLRFVWRKAVAMEDVGKVFVDVPQGIFPPMIVHLLKQEECVVQLSNPHDVSQFRDAVSFLFSFNKNDDDPHDQLYIINCKKHIEVIFTGKKESCSKINKLVQEVIEEAAKDINISIDGLNVAFACQRDESNYCIVKNAIDQEAVCRSKPSHTCTLDDSYWCWFTTSGSAQQHISDREGSGSPQYIKKELDKVLRENQVKIHGIFTETDDTLKEIARELNAVNIVGRVVQRSPTYDSIIGSFLGGINLKEDIEDIEEHSTKFFQSLSNVGGPVADASDLIKKKWKKAVKDKCTLELKI